MNEAKKAFWLSEDGTIYQMLDLSENRLFPNKFSQTDLSLLERYKLQGGGFVGFIKYFVEKKVELWQRKGEFEKLSDFQNRVNEQSRNEIVKLYTEEAKQLMLMSLYGVDVKFYLKEYDSEHETYLMSTTGFGDVVVPVPIVKAKSLKESWSGIKFANIEFYVDKGMLKIKNVDFIKGKEVLCHYDADVQADYQRIDIKYDFAKIELPQDYITPQNKEYSKGKTVKIGKSDIDNDIPIATKKQEKIFAVVISNEVYTREAHVPFANNDGIVFGEYCKKVFGLPENNVHIVSNATLNDARHEIQWLLDVMDAYNGEAKVIFYYAGHGITNDRGTDSYILPVDGYGSDVSTGISLTELYSMLGSKPAKSVQIFLDACFSGANRDGSMLASARGVAIKAKQTAPTGNLVVFSAAQGDETAWPYQEKQHGLFTYYLLKKIKETKGEISLGELGDYVSTEVKRQSIVTNRKSQTPTVNVSVSLGNNWKSWTLK